MDLAKLTKKKKKKMIWENKNLGSQFFLGNILDSFDLLILLLIFLINF